MNSTDRGRFGSPGTLDEVPSDAVMRMRNVRAVLLAAISAAVLGGCSSDLAMEETSSADSSVASIRDAPSVVHVGDSAVGCVSLDAPLQSVISACGEVVDTTIYLEGMPQEAVWVDVGPGRVLAEIVRDTVWRIRIEDPALTTSDSIRFGTPVSSLASYPGVRVSYEEGASAMTDAHCGRTFGVSGLPIRFERWTAEELGALPDSVRVNRILVHGNCDNR